jgi:hypothetical protein
VSRTVCRKVPVTYTYRVPRTILMKVPIAQPCCGQTAAADPVDLPSDTDELQTFALVSNKQS